MRFELPVLFGLVAAGLFIKRWETKHHIALMVFIALWIAFSYWKGH